MSYQTSYGATSTSHANSANYSPKMDDTASLASFSSTSSLLKKFKPSRSTSSTKTPKQIQEQALKSQGRKEKLKMPLFPGTIGPNPYV